MKILIVDDNPRRYERLVSKLDEVGVPRGSVDIVPSAMDARDRLAVTTYDLMIVDILLPLRPEDPPEERHSCELLTEIVETGDLNKPRHIVGLSAYKDAASKVAPFFRDHVWAVIDYSEQNDDWIHQIANCVRYVSAEVAAPRARDSMVDLVIVCALSDPELKAVLTLPWGWKSARPVDDVTFVHDGSLTDAAGRSISVIAAATSRMGMVSTALLGAKLIDMFRPRFIAMTGICAGTRGKANLGDAIVVDPSWDYQSGKRSEVNDSSSFAIGPHQLPLHLAVRSRFDQLKTDRAFLSSIRDGWPGAPDQVFKLLMGPVASGSAVLADGRVMNEIRQQHRELCGVEMEVYGLYAAAATAASPRPIAFAVKSVCDFGEADKNDSMQHYASYTSAAILCEFVKRFFSELNSC